VAAAHAIGATAVAVASGHTPAPELAKMNPRWLLPSLLNPARWVPALLGCAAEPAGRTLTLD